MLYFDLHLNECAGVAQSVEQLIRNQQVMCSSHTTSSKKHRKLRFSVLFCCKNAENGVGQNVGQLPDPHRDPHAEMHGKGERAPERKLLPFRCSACLWDLSNLRHEAAHRLCGLLLHLPCGVGVGAEGESGVIVPEHTADGFDVHSILQCQRCEGMPLRYNYDKPEKPRTSRVFGYLARFFILFQTEKSSREVVIS